MKTALSGAVVLAAISSALAARGVDVSSHIQPSTWTCLAEEQYEYAIIRAHLGSGGPDPVAPHSIYNWYSSLMYKKGGRLGIYLFPNVPRGEPEAQIAETIEYLKGYSITYSAERGLHTFDRIWLDIEPQAWSSDKAANAEFIAGLVKGCEEAGVQCGIYANWNSWAEIAGEWSGASHLPLWYPDYDGTESCSGFRPFGGWGRADYKQWQGDDTICGAEVDLNTGC
ncbi:unnamed protein product [Symbiodinium sp. KB8]|nr:unnamed protein product [Symbiodinium sp. KB8]